MGQLISNGFASTCWLSFQRVNLIVDFSVKYVATKFIQYDMFSRSLFSTPNW